MLNKIIVSNVRFPQDEWATLKSAANSHNMSINEYMRYMTRVMSMKTITSTKKIKPRKDPYQALRDLANFASSVKFKPMGANEDDKIIYGIE